VQTDVLVGPGNHVLTIVPTTERRLQIGYLLLP
jgi:hypothetical protein